ncbi:hypothetical protein GCM10009682_09830 [Luedemannella flava]|uniref:Uncharacterized protein n=1 Tax=Luedemannella flava TaxID=349316 RepID=A0ABP4XPC7_9ACTN
MSVTTAPQHDTRIGRQSRRWQLACLDMAGTTVRDNSLVEQAFTVAVAGQGVAPRTTAYEDALTIVRKTMGQSRIEVFRRMDPARIHTGRRPSVCRA